MNYEIIVIDDNSPDKTYEVAQQLAEIYGEKHIVRPVFSCIYQFCNCSRYYIAGLGNSVWDQRTAMASNSLRGTTLSSWMLTSRIMCV